ncbi:TRAP-type C4-dicarboxylate transport system, small permease component [Jannaschia seosinensis]|uniref:TRAP transporter small permease protein n=1 Tax=Jannaschia seosinensis TaxID=313367 RepID=A0A0M7BC15_9RHOB|nr:TRAP transporter small permease [Jannaschia seosinensis]CUH39931.1 TRAP-type C4-dicarboxylate transport system, small permease component [Jannaschia seosinensis]
MAAILNSIRWLGALNAGALAVGRWVGVACMALMVVFILVQVFWRYVLSDPLPWPEEAARFGMLWLMVVAPTALRRGGFVAIDMIQRILPRLLGGVLALILLVLSLVVLVVAVRIGWAEVTGFSGRFTSSSLYYPTSGGWEKMPRAWMMASLVTGLAMMVSVVVELILRQVVRLAGRGGALPPIPEAVDVAAGAE